MALALPKRLDREAPAFVLADEDWYTARFLNYDNPVPSTFKNKQTDEYPLRINLKFEISDEESDFNGVEVSGFFDFEMNSLNKGSIYNVIAALDPENEPDDDSTLDEHLNRKCRVEVKHSAPKMKNGREVVYANVMSVKPFKKKKPAAAPAETKPANPFTEDDEA